MRIGSTRSLPYLVGTWFLSTFFFFTNGVVGNQFLDDYGDVHILYEEPRVIAEAYTAISLVHFGMPKEWIIATWGSLYNRASNQYQGQASEYHSIDAQPDDLAIVRAVPSFNHPGCLDPSKGTDEGCWDDYDYDVVNSMRGSAANMIIDLAWAHDNEIAKNVSKIVGIPIVRLSSEFDGAIGCTPDPESNNYHAARNDNCLRRSYLDVVNRVHDLAVWMGIDTSQADQEDRLVLCKATEKLYKANEYAQQEGIRFATASIQGPPDKDLTMFMTNPLQFGMVRTMEELGMPVLWPGLCPDKETCLSYGDIPQGYEVISSDFYFKNCPPGQPDVTCGADPLYPIDFWLLEGYGLQQMEDDPQRFEREWPDRALRQNQYMAFSFDSHVYSYKSAAGWFEALADKIMSAQRLHPKTACTEAHVTSTAHVNYGAASLGGGQYACFHPQYHNQDYLTCPAQSNDGLGLSAGAVVGIVVGSLVVGGIVVFILMKFVLGYRTGIDKHYVEPRNTNKQEEEESDTNNDVMSGSLDISDA